MSGVSSHRKPPRVGDAPLVRRSLIAFVLIIGTLLVVAPLVIIGVEAFSQGWKAYSATITHPDTRHAIMLTVLTALIAVPVNTAFGVAAGWQRMRAPAGSGFNAWIRTLRSDPAAFALAVLSAFLVLKTLMLPGILKSGSNNNYLIEWLAAVVVFAGIGLRPAFAFAAGAPPPARKAPLLIVLAALIVLMQNVATLPMWHMSRQLIDRFFKDDANFALRHCFLRIDAGRRDRKVDDLRLGAVFPIALPVDSRLLLAQASQRLVHGYPCDPGAECRVAAKHVETGEGSDICLLHDVFGFGIVAEDAAGDPEKPAIVPGGEGADRRLVAQKHPPHQLLIGGDVSLSLRDRCQNHEGVLGYCPLDAPAAERFPVQDGFAI